MSDLMTQDEPLSPLLELEEYPAIVKQATSEKAEIHWCDEVGIKPECQALQSYSLKGKTPVVTNRSKRFSINMVSTVSNNGKLMNTKKVYAL